MKAETWAPGKFEGLKSRKTEEFLPSLSHLKCHSKDDDNRGNKYSVLDLLC